MAHPFVQWATSEQSTEGKCDISLYSNFQVITWNINGIRSMQNTDNLKSLKELLDGLRADVICLQETKVTRDMLDENTAFVEGYNSYFAFSRTKAGYSGVVTYCKDSATPVSAEEGLTGFFVPTGATDNVCNYNNSMNVEFSQAELKDLDYEGRAVMTEHNILVPDEHLTTGITNPQSLIIINVYCPRVDPEKPERKEYKLKFCRLLELRAKALIAAGSQVVIVGDLNISHQAIDTCEDVSKNPEFNTSPSRQWLNRLLYAHPKYNLYAYTESTWLREESRNTSFPDDQGAIDGIDDTTESRQWNHNDSFGEDGSTSETEFHIPIPGNDEFLKNRKSNVSVPKCCRNSCSITEKLSTELDNIPVMIDSFRCHNKDKQNAFTCWNTKSNARATNYGTRIDYILTCARAIPLVIDCHILSEVEGSDHCPVKAFFKGRFHPHFKCPSLCSRYFPEFAGKQVKITSMFRKCRTDEVFSSKKKIVTSDSDSKAANINSKALPKADLKRKQLKLDNFFPCPVSVKPKLGVTTCEPPNKTNNNSTTSAAAGLWKELLKGPKPAPLCMGHREPCVKRSVTKKGPNFKRTFWVCARGVGRRDDSSASCTHFAWK